MADDIFAAAAALDRKHGLEWMTGDFKTCEICGANDWRAMHSGPIRDGAFGDVRQDGLVARCSGCGIERLAERCCPPSAFYETDEYRKKLGQGLTTGAYFAEVDALQKFAFDVLATHDLRGRTIADVGCAGGSFLDHVSGLAGRKVAIEPSAIYTKSLIERGFDVFSYAPDAAAQFAGQVDLAVSFQVIEHVQNPRAFLADVKVLLAPNGRFVISTPNRRDILMELLPDRFPEFFYRVVHRWYFDADSLAKCASLAGFDVAETRFVHRYGMSNALTWLRDRRPGGHAQLGGIGHTADMFWRGHLEETGRADCLFMTLVHKATQ